MRKVGVSEATFYPRNKNFGTMLFSNLDWGGLDFVDTKFTQSEFFKLLGADVSERRVPTLPILKLARFRGVFCLDIRRLDSAVPTLWESDFLATCADDANCRNPR